LVYQSNSGYRSTQSVEAEARHAADEALALSPNLAIAHVSIGIVRLYFDLDFRGADRAYRQALLLDPRNPDIYVFLSDVSRAIGNAEESQTLLRSAINLDPLDELYYGFLGDLSYYLGRFTEAEVEYRKALAVAPDTTRMSAALGTILFSKGQLLPALEMMQREPDEEWREWGLSIVLYALGRRSDADSALTELKRAHADDSAFNIAEIYAFRKEIDPAFDWLDRAYQQRDPSLTTIKTDPWVLNLKPDPRWNAFLHKLRLPE
jgi:tetratricopeptide (TPR) repeat protein